MRKVLSFVLVLSLVLGSFSMAFAATTTSDKFSDIDGLACEDAVRVLSSLDVVSGYDDGTYKPEQTVTRAEMASLLIKSLGLKETDAVPRFTDSQNHWAKGFIAYANTLGIISGRSATVFDPDATVTYDEATTMIIKALGYTDDALNGTYPASYVSRAKVLGILDGITTGSGGANRGDVATMLYQALDQAIGKVDKDGNFQETVIEWDKSQSSTVAKKYDTMLERLGAKMFVPDTYVKESDSSFVLEGDEDAVININPYKGAVVSAYMNKDDEIIAIKEVFSTFLSGTINKDYVLSATDGVDYDLKAAAQTDLDNAAGTSSKGAISFVNGETEDLDGGVKIDDKTVYTLAVDASGKKISEVYSVALWNISKGDVLEADDVADIEKNHKLLGVEFDEDNNGDIDEESFELVGVDSLDDIKAGMVTYVYQNDDKLVARIAVSNKEVSGEISRSKDDGKKITIDGTEYKFAKEKLLNNGIDNANDPVESGKAEAGDTVTIKLDAYGYVFDLDKTDGQADKFAIVLGRDGKANDLDDPRVKLFLADGSVKTFDVKASDLEKDENGAITDLNSSLSVGMLVKYGVNKDGKITSIFAANTNPTTLDEEDLLFVTDANGSVSKKGIYDSREIASDAVIINYSSSTFDDMSTDEDDYSIVAYDKILDGDDVNAYYVYDKSDKQIVAIMLGDATTSSDTYGVVVGSGKNNSDAGGWFDMLVNGEEKSYDGDDDKVNKGGDGLYKLKFDADGAISDFEDWFKSGDKVRMASIAAVEEGDSNTAAKLSSRTFSYSASAFAFVEYNEKKDTNKGEAITSLTIDKNAVVYVYDEADDEWQIGSTSDLRNLEKDDRVFFYDIEDEDGVYDVIMIDQTGEVLK